MTTNATDQIREQLVAGIDRYERRRRRARAATVVTFVLIAAIGGGLALRDGDHRSRVEIGPSGTNGDAPLAGLHAVPPPPGRTPLPGPGVWTGTELLFAGAIDDAGTTVAVGFDPDARTWRTLAAAPIVLGEHTAAVWSGTELLVCCGLGTHGDGGGSAAAYDPSSDSWRELPAPPVSSYAWAVWTGDRMYLTDAEFAFTSFDPVSSQWRSEPDFNYPNYGFTQLLWTGSEIIEWPKPPQRTTWEGESFDPARGRWTSLPPPPQESWPAIATVVLVDRSIVVLGGLPANVGGESERFVAARFDLASREWTRLPDPLPEPRGCECNLGSHMSLWTGKDLLVFVGELASGASDDGVLLALDPADNSWRTVGDTRETALTPVAMAGDRVMFEAVGQDYYGEYYLSEPGWRPGYESSTSTQSTLCIGARHPWQAGPASDDESGDGLPPSGTATRELADRVLQEQGMALTTQYGAVSADVRVEDGRAWRRRDGSIEILDEQIATIVLLLPSADACPSMPTFGPDGVPLTFEVRSG